MADHEELTYPLLKILKPFLQDEVKNSEELIETLRCYVYQNGNIKETAGLLYCHYNSVLYRLERIESILGISVRNPDNFFHLQLAIRLYDFMRKMQPQLMTKVLLHLKF
ncbi:MAG: hypothetical protein A2189_06585 [Paenibacillus sp. RIFOXYA1_FULL_44_5]|nr:MAG: hypothetical protein A2189_06585 [Paenibacillus sp. RIFOXYA1_FULL_44_5]